MRFFLIDRITQWEPGRQATAVKNVALSEDYFDDHFPLKPIMPGVLLLEGMAQLSGLLIEEGERQRTGRNRKALLSLVDRAKFRLPVYPGDTLTYRAAVESANDAGATAVVQAQRDGKTVAECRLLFSFHQIDQPLLDERRAELLALWLREPSARD